MVTTDRTLEDLRRELTQGWALPQLLRPGQVARVTGLSYESIRYRLDENILLSSRDRPGAMRLVPIEEVARLCEELGIIPAWEEL